MPPSRSRPRKPLTKTMLLPLTTEHVQRLQRKHPVALAAATNGHGDTALIDAS